MRISVLAFHYRPILFVLFLSGMTLSLALSLFVALFDRDPFALVSGMAVGTLLSLLLTGAGGVFFLLYHKLAPHIGHLTFEADVSPDQPLPDADARGSADRTDSGLHTPRSRCTPMP